MPLTQVFVTNYFYSCNTLQQIPWLWSVLSLKYFQADKCLHSETHAGLPTVPSILPVSGRQCTCIAKVSHKVFLPPDFEGWSSQGVTSMLQQQPLQASSKPNHFCTHLSALLSGCSEKSRSHLGRVGSHFKLQ